MADKITIPQVKSKPSFKNIDKTFDTIKYLFTFFDYIELKKITFKNNHLKFIFTDDILYLASDAYEVAGNIHRVKKSLVAEVSMLYLKKKKINIKGKLIYHLYSDILETEGTFKAYNVEGRFKAERDNDTIDFLLSSDTFTDLRTLIKMFKMKKTVERWIIDGVQAKQYRLNKLEGRINVGDDEIDVDFSKLRGDAVLEKVKIFFQKGFAPVLANKVHLKYKNKALYFDLIEPSYMMRELNGSRVSITGLVDKTTRLHLDLNISSPLDDEVQKILQSYAVNIPVWYKDGHASIVLKMGIPLDDVYPEDEKMTTFVDVKVGEGNLKYDRIRLPLVDAKFTYDSTKKDEINVKATLKTGTVHIGKNRFPVLGGTGEYNKNIVTLKNIRLKESWYDGIIDGKVNIKSKKADLKFNAKKIVIGGKEKVIFLQNKLLPFTINYSEKLHISIPSLALNLYDEKDSLLIQVKKIEKIKPYFNNIPIKVEGGKLEIIQHDADTYTFKGELRRKSCFLYDKDDVCHTRVPCSGKISKNNFNFYAFGKRLHYDLSKSRIKIKDLNIDLEKFLSQKKYEKKIKSKKLVILGENSKIRYKKYTLVTDSYDIEIKPNGDIKAFGSSAGNIVEFLTQGKRFDLKALRVTDKMLHPLINFKGLKKGRYTIKQSGNPDKVIKGNIIIEGGVMSNFKAYNNTLAFINAIPALATLSSPGFSHKGFKIMEGVADYERIGDRVIFDSIYIKGASATIAGKGELDLNKRTIKMDLAIHTARELGKVVGNLPLLGYILMGKDKSMTIGLKISGSLDNPAVETSAAQDILSLPLQLIKRTLESPAHIINQ